MKVCDKHHQAYEDACLYCTPPTAPVLGSIGSRQVWDNLLSTVILSGSVWVNTTMSFTADADNLRFAMSLDMTNWRKHLNPLDGHVWVKLLYDSETLTLRVPMARAIPPGQIVTISFKVNTDGTIPVTGQNVVTGSQFKFEG